MRCDVEVPVGDFSDGDDFWLAASEPLLNLIWDNPEDDIYAELLEPDVSIPRQP